MKSFQDKVCVVTGAGSGIGRGLAADLAARGARLALSDVDGEGLAETRAVCEAAGAEVRTWILDVTSEEAWQEHAQDVLAAYGVVHMLVNNAGVALLADALDQTTAQLRTVMDVDFYGVAYGTQTFLPHLIASGDGALVNVSSLFGLIGVPTQSAYNAAKFAVRGYTESIAQEMDLAGHPVTVHTVHPGGIATNVARNAAMSETEAATAEAFHALFDAVARTSPEQCAGIILRGVRRGTRRILVGPDAWVLHLSQQLLGVRYQRLVAAGMDRAMRTARARFAKATGGDAAAERPTADVG